MSAPDRGVIDWRERLKSFRIGPCGVCCEGAQSCNFHPALGCGHVSCDIIAGDHLHSLRSRGELALNNRFQILSLDGGGIRGVFTAAVLAALEDDYHVRIADCLDLIAGTSTGGIIALGLGLGFTPREMVAFYADLGPEIFANRAWWRWPCCVPRPSSSRFGAASAGRRNPNSRDGLDPIATNVSTPRRSSLCGIRQGKLTPYFSGRGSHGSNGWQPALRR
jgi:hypothetical protein